MTSKDKKVVPLILEPLEKLSVLEAGPESCQKIITERCCRTATQPNIKFNFERACILAICDATRPPGTYCENQEALGHFTWTLWSGSQAIAVWPQRLLLSFFIKNQSHFLLPKGKSFCQYWSVCLTLRPFSEKTNPQNKKSEKQPRQGPNVVYLPTQTV